MGGIEERKHSEWLLMGKFCFGVGGDDKKNSSSWILENWKYESEDRVGENLTF